MRHSQHLLTESAWCKKVTCSIHRYMWPLSTWRRDKHALKSSTHAAKSFGKNREYRKFILMNVSGTDIACVLAFHKKRNINIFFYLNKRESSGQRLQLPSQEAESPLPVTLLTLMHHFRVMAPKLQTTPHRPASVFTRVLCSHTASVQQCQHWHLELFLKCTALSQNSVLVS